MDHLETDYVISDFSGIYNNVIKDNLLRNAGIFVLTVIACSYSIYGIFGSLLLFFSFLGGIFIFYKIFFMYKFVIPDLTKIFLPENNVPSSPTLQAKKRLMRQSTSDPGCRVCGDTECIRDQSPTHSTKPWEELMIPADVNQSLENLLTKVLDDYIEKWYKTIAEEKYFQKEIKYTIKHAASVLVHRLRKSNISDFILDRVLPVCANHFNDVDTYHSDKTKWHPSLTNRNVELDYLRSLTRQVIPLILPASSINCKLFFLLIQELLAGWILLPLSDAASDPTVLNGLLLYYLTSNAPEMSIKSETVSSLNSCSENTKSSSEHISPLNQYSPEKKDSKSADQFLSLQNDSPLLTKHTSEEKPPEGSTIEPNPSEEHESPLNNESVISDILSKTEAATVHLNENLNETNNTKENEVSVNNDILEEENNPNVKFLGTFAPLPEDHKDFWHPSLETILKNQSLLYAFMQYLKSQSDINLLQFCLDIEDFNSRMLAPDLTSDDLDMLYKDAWDLYSIYFSAHSPESIDFDPKICQELRKILSKDVIKLRTSPPLFKAYDFAYNRLDTLHVTNFHKSEEFFNWLCGPKILSSTNTSGINSPDSVDSPSKKKNKSPEGPVAKLSSRIQKITGVLKPNLVLEGQKDTDPNIDNEIEIAEPVKECEEEVERDLSKWKVTVFNSRNKTATQQFTVKVVRTDKSSDAPDSEWSVYRKINDFYALETKLTEFHGSFSDVQLPQKKLLTPCPEDSRVYENYLRHVLLKPVLRRSDLLFDFLTNETFEVEQFALGKLFRKSVPITLKKERGQNLDLFIKNFVESTKTKTSKIEWKDISEELKPRHVVNLTGGVHGNNLDEPNTGDQICNVTFQSNNACRDIFDGSAKCLLFVGIKLYQLSGALLRLAVILVILFKSTLDSLIQMFVEKHLSALLSSDRISYLIYLVQWNLFENTTIVDPVVLKTTLEYEIEQMSIFTRPAYKTIYSTLQQPLLNKQLFYHLFEEVLATLFPELVQGQSPIDMSSSVNTLNTSIEDIVQSCDEHNSSMNNFNIPHTDHNNDEFTKAENLIDKV